MSVDPFWVYVGIATGLFVLWLAFAIRMGLRHTRGRR